MVQLNIAYHFSAELRVSYNMVYSGLYKCNQYNAL